MTPAVDRPLAPCVQDWTALERWLCREAWERVGGQGPAVLHRCDDALLLLERPGALRARQRRSLHRSGFRPTHEPQTRRTVWVWRPPEVACTEPAARVARVLAGMVLQSATAVHVLRDVFGLTLASLLVTVADEEEDDFWDDVDEDGPEDEGLERCRGGWGA